MIAGWLVALGLAWGLGYVMGRARKVPVPEQTAPKVAAAAALERVEAEKAAALAVHDPDEAAGWAALLAQRDTLRVQADKVGAAGE